MHKKKRRRKKCSIRKIFQVNPTHLFIKGSTGVLYKIKLTARVIVNIQVCGSTFCSRPLSPLHSWPMYCAESCRRRNENSWKYFNRVPWNVSGMSLFVLKREISCSLCLHLLLFFLLFFLLLLFVLLQGPGSKYFPIKIFIWILNWQLICLFVYLSVCLPICLSIYLFLCLSASLSLFLFFFSLSFYLFSLYLSLSL